MFKESVRPISGNQWVYRREFVWFLRFLDQEINLFWDGPEECGFFRDSKGNLAGEGTMFPFQLLFLKNDYERENREKVRRMAFLRNLDEELGLK